MGRTQTYFDLCDALALPGCPICRLTESTVERFVDGLIYEKVNDPGLRSRIRESRGFCQQHARTLQRHGAALGVAIIMRDVLRDLLKATHAARSGPTQDRWYHRLARRLGHIKPSVPALIAAASPQGACVVCEDVARLQKNCYEALWEALADDGTFRATLKASDGLCLPHFAQAIAYAPTAEHAYTLLDIQQDLWRALEEQLSEAVRKSDYRFQDEAVGVEGTAWLRALVATSGNRIGSS